MCAPQARGPADSFTLMARITTLSSVFDLIGGLPVHPLAVHVAVVLVPLAALALVALVFLPKQRSTFLPIVAIAAALGTFATFVAKESGEALSERVGLPQTHADLGDIMFPASVGLTLIAIAFWVLSKSQRPAWQLRVAMTASVIAAIGVSGLSFLVGHSGAEATWANRVAVVVAAPEQTDTQTQLTGDEISVEELAKHNSASDCWTSVNDRVIDLTSYLSSHPGGEGVLLQICGKDGTAAFESQHSGQGSPMAQLDALVIGSLAGDAVAPEASAPTQEPVTVAALTAAEVAKHASAADCWSVVSGKVYDLTSYVNSHPGGSGAISALCGKDGTQAFSGQHGGAPSPTNTLAAFLVGNLVGDTQAGAALPQATSNEYEEDEGDEEEGEEH